MEVCVWKQHWLNLENSSFLQMIKYLQHVYIFINQEPPVIYWPCWLLCTFPSLEIHPETPSGLSCTEAEV